MSDRSLETPPGPVEWITSRLRGMWRDAKSVYYANTPIWRLLKSAALVFLGLFCWAGANLLLSFFPDSTILWLLLSYGFLLLFWGPLTHFVVVPLVIRLRRTGDSPVTRWFSRHGSKLNLTIFVILVIVLAAFPLGIMTFQFTLPTGGDAGSVNPQLQCTQSAETVHCHLSSSAGVDHVHILTGGELLQELHEPPFEFNVRIDELATINGDEQFTVELRDADDTLIRRYVRRVDLIPGG